jgi:hypothetical protein
MPCRESDLSETKTWLAAKRRLVEFKPANDAVGVVLDPVGGMLGVPLLSDDFEAVRGACSPGRLSCLAVFAWIDVVGKQLGASES